MILVHNWIMKKKNVWTLNWNSRIKGSTHNSSATTKILKNRLTKPFFPYYCISAVVDQSVNKIRKQHGDRYYPQIYLKGNQRKVASK